MLSYDTTHKLLALYRDGPRGQGGVGHQLDICSWAQELALFRENAFNGSIAFQESTHNASVLRRLFGKKRVPATWRFEFQ